MSAAVTLTVRDSLEERIDADSIVPDAFAALGETEIAELPVWVGRRQAALGDYFRVQGGRAASVRIAGEVELVHGIGTRMAGGELVIDGNAGSHVGAEMTGGNIDVRGSVRDDGGTGMSGGSLRIRGSAGDRVGAGSPGTARGMTGGEVVVEGSVGMDAGARMRRGLLFIGGDAHEWTARSMIAGTVVVVGRVGREPGHASKRGSLIVAGGIDVPVTYRYACEYQPPHVRLALTYVSRRYGLSISQSIIGGTYRRYCGDASTIARGEILEWVS